VWIFSFVLVASFVNPAHAAHTYHASLMQMEFDEQENLVEISIQVFTNDLENILSRRSGKPVRLDKSTTVAQLALAYLNDAVSLKNREGQMMTLSWVGMETKTDTVWLYLETKMPEGLEGISVRNRIFFELFPDQVNRVHVKQGERKYDLVFKPGDDFKSITPTRGEVK
jgi:hypothetical protein